MSKNKAERLLAQLEEDGLENTHRTLAIFHQVLCELVGVETALEIPAKHVAKEPRKMVPEGVSGPPSAGEERHMKMHSHVARDARLDRVKPSTVTSGDGPDNGEPGAKDSRIAEDGQVEDAKNTLGSSKKAKKAVAKVKAKIAADEELAEAHGVDAGDDHPDDAGFDADETAEDESPAPARATKTRKGGKKRR